jgi:hypothetical protein
MESSWIVLTVSAGALFLVAYTTLHCYVFKDFKVLVTQLKSRSGSLLFSCTFACSGLMLEMFLLELSSTQVNDAEWTLILSLFSFLMLWVIPALACFKLFRGWRLRVLFVVVGLVLQAFAVQFSWQLLQVYLLGCDSECQEETCPGLCLFSTLVEQVRVLGVSGMMLSAVLSGFGAVNSTYNYFNFFNLSVSQGDLTLLLQQSQVTARELTQLKAKSPSPSSQWSWLRSDPSEEYLAAEIRALEAVSQEYTESKANSDIQDIQTHRQREQLSHSLRGKLYSIWARVLAVYAVYKLVFVTPS